MKPMPSIAHLHECFDPDYISGFLFWRKRPQTHFASVGRAESWNKVYSGRQAGGLIGNGYLVTFVQKRSHYVHRILFAMASGAEPDREIDHVNGIKTDNQMSNLRLATSAQNKANIASGHTGLRGTKAHQGRWVAQMSIDGKNHYIGIFDTQEQAHAAYCQTVTQIRGEFALTTHTRI
ncbi:MAG: HNH endonuclease [Janthinobacterium lividum]